MMQACDIKSYFQLFGFDKMQIKFDANELDAVYLKLLQNAGGDMDMCSFINTGYDILQNDILRISHIIELLKQEIAWGQKTIGQRLLKQEAVNDGAIINNKVELEQEFLERCFDVNESCNNATAGELKKIHTEYTIEYEDILQKMQNLLDQINEAKMQKQQFYLLLVEFEYLFAKLKFIVNILDVC